MNGQKMYKAEDSVGRKSVVSRSSQLPNFIFFSTKLILFCKQCLIGSGTNHRSGDIRYATGGFLDKQLSEISMSIFRIFSISLIFNLVTANDRQKSLYFRS